MGFDLDKNPRQVRASLGIVPQVNLDAFLALKNFLSFKLVFMELQRKIELQI